MDVPLAEVDRVPVVSSRQRREPRYYDPHGPPTEGDFASAARRVAVQGSDECGSQTGIATSSRVDVPGPSAVVASLPSTSVSIEAAPVPTIRALSAALQGRDSEEGAIMQAEVILAAARCELASILDVLGSARAIVDVVIGSVADCSAAVATARRHLGRGSSGDDQGA